MTLAEILPEIRCLPRLEKLQLIQMLAAEIASEGGDAVELPTEPLPVWSPWDSYEAAETLAKLLESSGSGKL